MPEFSVHLPTEPSLIEASPQVRGHILQTFKRILGPAVPPGRYLQCQIDAKPGGTSLTLGCYVGFPENGDILILVKEAAAEAQICKYDWTTNPLLLPLGHYAPSAHEVIEQIAQKKEMQ